MPPTEVKMGHFMDMRNYNPDYEHGWSVQRFVARKKYYQWLRNVRRTLVGKI